MTQGTVNEVGRSQRGTPKLKINGKWYVASRLNLDGIQSGSVVEFEEGSFPGQNGQVACINKIRPVAAANGSGPAKTANAVSDDAEMRFISNCVGSAITAGTLKDPVDIAKWVAAARGALKQHVDPEFNDDLPEF